MEKKNKLSFGAKGLKKEVSLETSSMILDEKFVEVIMTRVSMEMHRDIEFLARKLGISNAEMVRRMLTYALIKGQKCIAPNIVVDAIRMAYDRETYMRHIRVLQKAGIELTPDVINEVKRSIETEE